MLELIFHCRYSFAMLTQVCNLSLPEYVKNAGLKVVFGHRYVLRDKQGRLIK